MSSKYERKLLWHPRRENKFVVGGGSQLSLYDWAPQSSEIRLLATQADLQHLKCFSWSPDSNIDDMIAIGTTTGKVDLCRLQANRFSKSNVVTGGIEATLTVQNSRACNALSFCSVKPHLLAVGSDKGRGVPSLVVWDVKQSEGSSRAGGQHNSRSITQGKQEQRYALAETVTSVSFLTNSADLLVAAVSNLWLRQFDLRVNDQHVLSAAAVKVQSIVVDPLDPHRIASFGENTVMVWDSRRISSPLLTFSLRDATADGAQYYPNDHFAHVEFSPVRRGYLATLTREASHVRFWDVQQTPTFETSTEEERSYRESHKDVPRTSKLSRLSWAASSTILPWNASPETLVPSVQISSGTSNITLANTTRSTILSRPLLSFALAPSSQAHPHMTNIAVINKDGDLKMHSMPNVPQSIVWSSRGELALGSGVDYKLYPAYKEQGPTAEPWELEQALKLTTEGVNNASGVSDGSELTRSIVSEDIESGSQAKNTGRGRDVLSNRRTSSLSAARLTKGRTYSPASIRQYSHEHPGHTDLKVVRTDAAPSTQNSNQQSSNRNEVGNSIAHAPKARGHTGDARILEQDISAVMRSRVIQGYGLFNISHNSSVIKDRTGNGSVLREIWIWLRHAKNLLTFGSSKVHGIDFSFQGILGIWEGLEASPSQDMISLLDGLDLASPSDFSTNLPNDSYALDVDVNASLRPRLSANRSQRLGDGFHGNYTAALNTLNSRTNLNGDKLTFKSSVQTDKIQRRKLSLALCNWKVGDEEIARWEKEGQCSRAACWLLFTNQGGRAIELLMRSKDESHLMMSGTIAAILQSGSSLRNQELHDYCAKLIIKLQDHYFRIILLYIVFNDWSQVLEEDALPLRERIAIALRFLDDKELTFYLRRVADDCRSKGNVEGIIVTGLTQQGLDILQGYVDRTGDVQSAAILASYVCPGRHKDRRVERWTESYRDLLDGWKLFHYRCQFDIDRGKIMKEGIANGDFEPIEWVQQQFLIRCNFCNKVVNNTSQQQRPQEPVSLQRKRAATCPWCGRALPRCSVCLMSICVVTDPAREKDLLHSSFRDTIDDALVFCQTCRHGGHASHMMEWFYSEDGERKTCPIADCDCHCDE